MFSFLLGFHFFITILLISLVLLQKTDSDGTLSSSKNSLNAAFSGKGRNNIIINATWTMAGIFVLNCIFLARMAPDCCKKDSGAVEMALENK